MLIKFVKITDMNERIKLLLSEYGLSASKFAETIGVQASGISHIISGRNKPGYDFIIKVLESFPDLDPDWLLTGKGEMHRQAAGATSKTIDSKNNGNNNINISMPPSDAARENIVANPTSTVQSSQSAKERVENNKEAPPVNVNAQNMLSKSSEVASSTVDNHAAEANVPAMATSSDKKIELVMIFYSDKTFISYKPN